MRGREIAFGNVLAGGPHGLRRTLSDSNVDWGQGQGRLFARVRAGGLGRAGVLALETNEDEATALGLAPVVDVATLDRFDSVFVSVHLLDVAPGVERSPEDSSKMRWAKSWLVPLVHGIEARAEAREDVGDEYVLFRLRRPLTAPHP